MWARNSVQQSLRLPHPLVATTASITAAATTNVTTTGMTAAARRIIHPLGWTHKNVDYQLSLICEKVQLAGGKRGNWNGGRGVG